MRIYLAGSYSRRLELLARARELEALGHAITSRWLDGHHETRPDIDGNGTVEERAEWAGEDIRDLLDSQCIIVFNDGQPGTRGGKHFEAGYAMCLMGDGEQPMTWLWVIGDRSNPFYCRPVWNWFADWPECLAWAKRWY